MNLPILQKVGIRDVQFGANVTVVEPVNLYSCRLGEAVFVGPFVEIQKDVEIGPGTRIQSHAFICAGTRIGADCFISHGVKFVNDTFKSGTASRNPKNWKYALVEDGVAIGTNATLLPVKIVKGVVIGAGSVVTKDLLIPGIYAGNPARFIRA